jgi:hypothetical protein
MQGADALLLRVLRVLLGAAIEPSGEGTARPRPSQIFHELGEARPRSSPCFGHAAGRLVLVLVLMKGGVEAQIFPELADPRPRSTPTFGRTAGTPAGARSLHARRPGAARRARGRRRGENLPRARRPSTAARVEVLGVEVLGVEAWHRPRRGHIMAAPGLPLGEIFPEISRP